MKRRPYAVTLVMIALVSACTTTTAHEPERSSMTSSTAPVFAPPDALAGAPIVWDHSRPPSILCRARDLDGGLRFWTDDHHGTGELTVRLKNGGAETCHIVGMLVAQHFRLIDADGETIATARDLRGQMGTEPPAYDIIYLAGTKAATMYITYCGPRIPAQVVFDAGVGPLSLPVDGVPSCDDDAGCGSRIKRPSRSRCAPVPSVA